MDKRRFRRESFTFRRASPRLDTGMLTNSLILALLFSVSVDKLDATPGLTVWVYNYAGVPDDILEEAEGIASQIFGNSGIELTWTGCPVHGGERSRYPDCRGRLGRLHLVLRILPAAPQRFARIKSIFGSARVKPETEQYAAIRDLASDLVEMGWLPVGSG